MNARNQFFRQPMIMTALCAFVLLLGAYFVVATGHHALAAGTNSDQQNVVAIQDTGQAGHQQIAFGANGTSGCGQLAANPDAGMTGSHLFASANNNLNTDGRHMALMRTIDGQQQTAMQATLGLGIYEVAAILGTQHFQRQVASSSSTFDYGHVAWRDTGGYQIAAINRQHFTFNRGPQTRGPTIAYMDGQSGGLGHRLALTRLQEGAQHHLV